MYGIKILSSLGQSQKFTYRSCVMPVMLVNILEPANNSEPVKILVTLYLNCKILLI